MNRSLALLDGNTGEAAASCLVAFRRDRSPNLGERWRRFSTMLDGLRDAGQYQAQYRLELLGPIDHEILVRDPFTSRPKRMTCFDSNSYLGLHLHRRVVAAVRRALDEAGYGTPSAQLLAGTNRWLTELEEVVAAFHGREAALVFPSGYAANVGILTGLVGGGDAVVRDRLCHASLHDGCRFSGARSAVYAHRDPVSLDRALARESADGGARLVVTDGVFSMHGRIAPLPELRRTADRHRALLYVDEAHATGVLGPTGRGTEEHFGLAGSVDVLMGTFSKAAGAAGGYVVGSREMVDYLRFHAHAGLFTASLPAPVCAGVAEAFRVMADEPALRRRLWANTRRFAAALSASGLTVVSTDSPILSIVAGRAERLLAAGRDLFDAGVRCGVVTYPAVPPDESLLRLTVNARHTDEEIDRTATILAEVAARHGFAGRAPERAGATRLAGDGSAA
jgi:8-amino-7-oxononanoate synthase